MKKRLLSLALAAVMTFSSLALTACNGGTSVDGKPGNGARTTKDLTNVYKADSVSTVGTLFENLQINQVYKMNDGKLLVCGYTTEDYEDKYYITDIDFKNASEMTIKKAEGQNSDTHIRNGKAIPTNASTSAPYTPLGANNKGKNPECRLRLEKKRALLLNAEVYTLHTTTTTYI